MTTCRSVLFAFPLAALAVVLAGCSSPYAQRAAVPPPVRADEETPRVPAVPRREAHVPRVAPRSVQRAEDEAATDAWLEKTAKESRERDPERPPVPIQVERVVERQVYVQPEGSPHYDAYGNPVYAQRPYDPYGAFPVSTVAGATIGAFAGGCHDNGEAALIGAGIGFLFDLARWN